jgi:hypothetical protein
MRPRPFHYAVISYFTALTGKAQKASEELSALHTGCCEAGGGRREVADGQKEDKPLHQHPCHTKAKVGKEESFPLRLKK